MVVMSEKDKEEECIEGCEACWCDSNEDQGRQLLFRDQPQPVSSCTSAVYQVTLQDLNNARLSLSACWAKAWILWSNLKTWWQASCYLSVDLWKRLGGWGEPCWGKRSVHRDASNSTAWYISIHLQVPSQKRRSGRLADVVKIIFHGCMQGLEQMWDLRDYHMWLHVIIRTCREEITGFL